MSVIAELNIMPLGRGATIRKNRTTGQAGKIGEGIARAVRIVEASGLPYKVHAMGTLIEGTLDAILEVVRRCHRDAARHSGRVITTLRLDDRPVIQRKRGRARRRARTRTS